jgi:hypothetical protein
VPNTPRQRRDRRYTRRQLIQTPAATITGPTGCAKRSCTGRAGLTGAIRPADRPGFTCRAGGSGLAGKDGPDIGGWREFGVVDEEVWVVAVED